MYEYDFKLPKSFDPIKDEKFLKILSGYPSTMSYAKLSDEFMKYLYESCENLEQQKQLFNKMFELFYFQIDSLLDDNKMLQLRIVNLQKVLKTYVDAKKKYDEFDKQLNMLDEQYDLYLIKSVEEDLADKNKKIVNRCKKSKKRIDEKIKSLD